MEYLVRLVYMDDKTQDITIPSERFAMFEECLKTQNIYWYDDNKSGFWTDLTHVRNVRFQKIEEGEQQPEVKKEEEAPKDDCASEHISPDPEKEVVPE